ncbi:hypothetical protein M0R45_025026 [Rubus argutus]|uniref:Uncharacterized protein n=1 Tax=Rubus argutus TaxID=59490 RepID=A0AAW1WSW3_RUBAR
MSGRSSSVAALVAMMVVMMTMLITQTHCFSIHQTIAVSYSAGCDGLNDDLSCLVGQTDLDEFMLDSEFSKRILQATGGTKSYNTLNPGKAASCDRKGFPPCVYSGKNSNPSAVQCQKAPTNRECYNYGKHST